VMVARQKQEHMSSRLLEFARGRMLLLVLDELVQTSSGKWTTRRRRTDDRSLTEAIEARFGWVRTCSCMPVTCEYAFVTARSCSPGSAELTKSEGKIGGTRVLDSLVVLVRRRAAMRLSENRSAPSQRTYRRAARNASLVSNFSTMNPWASAAAVAIIVGSFGAFELYGFLQPTPPTRRASKPLQADQSP
jgi:hypothetical protein